MRKCHLTLQATDVLAVAIKECEAIPATDKMWWKKTAQRA